MEFEKVVFGRRSVRKYTTEPVSEEDLRYVLEAGMYAPSGVNLQPWYFVAIRSPEQMQKLAGVMDHVAGQIAPMLEKRFVNNPEVAEETVQFMRKLGGAPVCVLAFQYRTSYGEDNTGIIQSVSAAMENMLLAAYDRGLGSCWMTSPLGVPGAAGQLRALFAPDKGAMLAMFTLGHPATEPKAPARKAGRFEII